MDMVQQPVQQRGRQRCIVGKGLVPLSEWQVGRQDQAAHLVALGDDLEQQVGLFPTHRQIPYLVDDQQSVRPDDTLDGFLQGVLAHGRAQGHQQIGRRDELNRLGN